MTAPPVKAVVLDVGGVLLDWDPRYLYRKLLPDEHEVDRFLTAVGFTEWNARQDAGGGWDEAVAELSARFPEYSGLIREYRQRWRETISGPLSSTVAVLEELRGDGVPTYALSNFAADCWWDACEAWPFLRDFDGQVISGFEGVVKPDPAIYRLLLDRYRLCPQAVFFTDDVPANVAGARAVGIDAEVFTHAELLRSQLVARGVLPTTG